MDIHDIRAKLAKDAPTIGTWLQLPSADVAELMARAGYDWVAVDMEHGSFGRTGLPDIFRAIQCGGAAPFARLPAASRTAVKAALEAGAQGLIFPMIESRAQLDQAISWATYPGHDDGRQEGEPLRENRGVGFCRANAFGKDFDAYMRDTAPRIFLVAQIEHIRAVEDLDAILSQPRLDAIMVGPYDLSGSMGLTGQFDHPDFKAVMARIHEACRRHHARMGLHVVQPDPEELRRQVAAGSRFIACTGYPDCNYTAPVATGVMCPRCGEGRMVEKSTKRGKIFYSCDRYPQCDFALWDKPVPGPCPRCDSSYLVEKRGRDGSVKVMCPTKGCGYVKGGDDGQDA